jgi:hypothetical protein
LLFVFAFPDQIISANHFANQGGKEDGVFEVEIPPKITEQQLESLLPDGIGWSIVTNGTTMFQLQQISNAFDDISNLVVILQVIMDVQLTWVVDSDDCIHMWMHSDIADAVLSQVQRDDWECTDVRDPFALYQSSKGRSKSLQKLLRKVVASVATSFYLNRIERGATQLNCRGCKLNEVQLRQLFGPACKWKAQGMQAKRVLQIPEKDDRGALIEEMPFAARLLLSMQHRNGAIKVAASPAAPVGAGEDAKRNEPLELKIKLPRPKWAPGGDMTLGRGSHVVVGNYTMTNAAVQLAKEPVYAVASSVMALGKGGQTWLAGGVTLLPPGNRGGWLFLARACAPSLEEEDEAAAKVEPVPGCDVSEEQFMQARDLSSRFQTLMTFGRLGGDPKCTRLLQDLQELFAFYLPTKEQERRYAAVRAKSKYHYTYSAAQEAQLVAKSKAKHSALDADSSSGTGKQGDRMRSHSSYSSDGNGKGGKRGNHNRGEGHGNGHGDGHGNGQVRVRVKGGKGGKGGASAQVRPSSKSPSSPTPIGQVLARLLVLIKQPQKLGDVALLYKKRFASPLDAASIVGSHSLNRLFQEVPFVQHFRLYQNGKVCYVAPEAKAASYGAQAGGSRSMPKEVRSAPQLMPSKIMMRGGSGGYDPRGKPTVIGGMAMLSVDAADGSSSSSNAQRQQPARVGNRGQNSNGQHQTVKGGGIDNENKSEEGVEKQLGKNAKRNAKRKEKNKQLAAAKQQGKGVRGPEVLAPAVSAFFSQASTSTTVADHAGTLAPGVAALFQAAASSNGVDVDVD